jgi:hypothetical protein
MLFCCSLKLRSQKAPNVKALSHYCVSYYSGALLGVTCDSRQGPFLGDSAVLKSRRTTVKKGEKATATLFYLFSTATALYFKNRHSTLAQRRLRHSVYSSFCNGASVNSRYTCRIFFSQYFLMHFVVTC